MGTPPVANTYAAEAGLQIIEKVGIHNINEQRVQLTDAIKTLAGMHGYTIATPSRHGSMIAIRAHNVAKLIGLLAKDNIIVSRYGAYMTRRSKSSLRWSPIRSTTTVVSLSSLHLTWSSSTMRSRDELR